MGRKKTEYLLAWCSLLHSVNLIFNKTTLKTYILTPTQDVCKGKIFAIVACYACSNPFKFDMQHDHIGHILKSSFVYLDLCGGVAILAPGA